MSGLEASRILRHELKYEGVILGRLIRVISNIF